MPDIIVYIPNHNYDDGDLVYVSWLDANYTVGDEQADSFKLVISPFVKYNEGLYGAGTYGGEYVQFVTTVTDGFVRLTTDTGVTTIYGLDHLEGQTVTVTSGGNVIGSFIVSDGAVVLSQELTTYQAGLPYSAKIRTTRLAVPQTGSALQGQIKRIDRSVVRYLKTKEGKAGQEYRVDQVSGESPFVEFTSDMEAVFDKESRDSKIPIQGGFDSDSYSIVKSDTPFPMTTLAIVVDFTIDEAR